LIAVLCVECGVGAMALIERVLHRIWPTRVIGGGKAAGLKLVAARADPDFALGVYELPMQEAIAASLREGDVFYDIGANIGFFSLIAARCVRAAGRVYAFEPVPANADAIRKSSTLNGMNMIDVFAEAVGAESGCGELLLARHIGGAALASAGAPPDLRGRIKVDVVAIDHVVARRGMRPPTLVKIDVEGAEMDVLRGMRGTIQRWRPTIIYEVDDATREGLERKMVVIASFMRSTEYKLTMLSASYRDASWHVEHVLARPVEH